LTSALDGGEWSASRPGRFTLSERAHFAVNSHKIRESVKQAVKGNKCGSKQN